MISQVTTRIIKARIFAEKKHAAQRDDDGYPYFFHCEQVAQILSIVTQEDHIICAGYLHDTIEDTDTTYDELVTEFGKEIADLVMEVTHDGAKDRHGYYFPRLHSKDGILIKFADRISNLSRMGSWHQVRQEHYLKKSKFWKSEP